MVVDGDVCWRGEGLAKRVDNKGEFGSFIANPAPTPASFSERKRKF
jgi:hypothetical protein